MILVHEIFFFPELSDYVAPTPDGPLYPGPGQGKLLNANHQYYAWQYNFVESNSASVAFQLSRIKSAAYPWGFAIEVYFSGDPGAFELQVQGAEIDQESSYCQLGSSITTVDADYSNRADYKMYYPKFVRVYLKTITNPVYTTVIVTR